MTTKFVGSRLAANNGPGQNGDARASSIDPTDDVRKSTNPSQLLVTSRGVDLPSTTFGDAEPVVSPPATHGHRNRIADAIATIPSKLGYRGK